MKFKTDNFKDKTKELHEKNIRGFGFDFHPKVSFSSAGFVLLFLLFAVLRPDQANATFSSFKESIASNWNWFFTMFSVVFFIAPLILAFSQLGKIRIGGPDAKPEFSSFSWYAMLFSAGMGIGLLFWGVGEPITHLNSQLPLFRGVNSPAHAMATTYLHWGMHAWGIYALVALALAFFAYNRGLPLSLRSVFYPLFKDKVFGILGDVIDTLAVVSCLFGLATSLAFGAKQINSGLNFLTGLQQNSTIQVIIIAVITLFATLSVISGIGKGVKMLSKLNIRIAAIFMILIFSFGPTIYILRLFSNSLSIYFQEFFHISLWVEQGKAEWQSSWTIFYWAWWISWSPFVGMFIARISKGRTVKEFVVAILLVPSLLSFFWMSVFGGTAIFQSLNDGGVILEAIKSNISTALFVMIENIQIPFAGNFIHLILSILGTLLVISFFVTSSDSGSLVVDNLTSGGKLDSPIAQRVFWASMEGLIAMALLFSGGDNAINALQTAVVLSGFPFAFILLVMVYSLFKELSRDTKIIKKYREDRLINRIFNEKIHTKINFSKKDLFPEEKPKTRKN